VAKARRPVRGNKFELPLEELARRQGTEKIRQKAATPKKLGDVMPTLMARRGYARLKSSDDLQSAWEQAAERFAKFSRAGKVQRGTLEVIVGNSTVLQELNFAQVQILARLQKFAPDAGVSKLRFRTGKLA
jgi:hypothetical protein